MLLLGQPRNHAGNAQPVATADSQGRGIFDSTKWIEITNIFQSQWQPWLLLSMALGGG
jgi:hypothetical protein